MSHYLCITIEKKMHSVKQDFWWALIFEGMHQASFQFQDPRKDNKSGSYFLNEEVEDPFKNLWNLIYTSSDNPLISFWHSSFDPSLLFDCEVSLIERSSNCWEINITLDDTHLWHQNAKERFYIFIKAALSLYDFCSPCSIHMYWDEEFVSQQLLKVQSKIKKEHLESFEFWGKKLFWREIAQINEEHIFIPDAMPIYVGGREGFRFLE